jgi:hypothetical protein
LSTDGQALGMGDGSLDSPLNQKVLVCGQVAFEKQRRTENRSAVSRATVRIAHEIPPGVEDGGRGVAAYLA